MRLARLLEAAARRGRELLILGLVVGVAMPALAQTLQPLLPLLVAAMLFLAALRVGPRAAVGALGDLRRAAVVVLVLQVALPLAAVGLLGVFRTAGTPLATALVLVLAAPPISGSPNLTVLTGNDPAPALRLMILATAALPVTALAVLLLLPGLGSAVTVVAAAGRLLAVIGLAAAAAFALRRLALPDPSPDALRRIDGLAALTMAVMVVGLMSAVGPALVERPGALAKALALAFALNFGLQIVASKAMAAGRFAPFRAAYAICAGNRNVALFLAALPLAATEPLLLFIGCYQVPMYLTPVLLSRLHACDRIAKGPQ